MAKNARIVLTTVGPFALHGEALFQACADHGTDYIDSTGEPLFVRSMRARFGARAKERGALMVSCCGLDSIPTDLGLFFTMRELKATGSVEVEGLLEVRARASGGTWHSAIEALRDARQALATRELPATAPGRRIARVDGTLHRDAELGWVVPFPSVDPEVALESAALLDHYGPDFSYAHYLVLRTLSRVALLGSGALGAYGLSQLSPGRVLLGRLLSPGEGPSQDERQKSWFKLRFRAKHADGLLTTEVSGGDPGYDETAKMLSESALCLAQDRERLPARAGVLTPACAFGEVLLARLVRAGLVFRVVSS